MRIQTVNSARPSSGLSKNDVTNYRTLHRGSVTGRTTDPLPHSLRGGGVTALMFALALLAGCTAPRQTQEDESTAGAPPPITLSAEQVHSPSGDLTARIPKAWVTLEAAKLESPQVFAVMCNPEYTMTVIFSETPVDNAARGIFSRNGLRGLVDASFQRRRKRSDSRATIVGEVEEFAVGRRQFAAYTYTTDSTQTFTRVAVFYTNSHLYECAITHLTFSARELPGMKLVRAIHQVVLGGIEW